MSEHQAKIDQIVATLDHLSTTLVKVLLVLEDINRGDRSKYNCNICGGEVEFKGGKPVKGNWGSK